MTKKELIKVLNDKAENGYDEIILYMKGRWRKRDYRVMYGVKGEIIKEAANNSLMCVFPIKELLNALNT